MATKLLGARFDADLLKRFNVALTFREQTASSVLSDFMRAYIEETKKKLKSGEIEGL